MVPWEEYRYACFARKFGWTPAQVDDLPLSVAKWMFPIVSALDAEENKRQEQAQRDAERRTKKFSRRRG